MPVECDFCSTMTFLAVVYGCRPFRQGYVRRGDRTIPIVCFCHDGRTVRAGDQVATLEHATPWRACPDCAALVEAGDPAGLWRRAERRFRATLPAAPWGQTRDLLENGRAVHRGFWLHRLPAEAWA